MKGSTKYTGGSRGSYTVEACIITTALLLILFALIFCFMLLCQKAMLAAVAKHCAHKGAEVWTDSNMNSISESSSSEDNRISLYYRITELKETYNKTVNLSKEVDYEIAQAASDYKAQGGSLKKLAYIRYELYSRLKSSLMKPEMTRIDIDYNNYFISSRLKVTITQEIKIPFGFIKAIFDGKDTVTLEATGSSVIIEPAEYIRNIDLAVECGKRIKDSEALEGLIGRLKGEAAKE